MQSMLSLHLTLTMINNQSAQYIYAAAMVQKTKHLFELSIIKQHSFSNTWFTCFLEVQYWILSLNLKDFTF